MCWIPFVMGMGLRALRSLDIFGLLVLTKSIFVMFMCMYNMGKAIANLWMCMNSHFGLCVCVNVFFFVYKSQSSMGTSSNPQQVFMYVHCVGTRSKVLKVCFNVCGPWGLGVCSMYMVWFKFVAWNCHNGNLVKHP